MANRKVFEIKVDEDIRIVVVFYREKNRITNFVVVLEAKRSVSDVETDDWEQVIRFDTSYGYPHMHKLDKNGNKKSTINFDYLSNEEALNAAIDILKENRDLFVKEFRND